MDRNFDVLVIGGGSAGLAAVLAAADRGRRVGLVRAGPGASALAAGGWHGPLPERVAAALAAAGLAHEAVAAPLPHPTGALRTYDFAAPAQRAAVVEDGALVCGIAGLPAFHAPALARLWGDADGAALAATTIEPGPDTPPGGWSPVALAGALDREPGLLAEPLARAVRTHAATRAILPPVLGDERADAVRAALEDAAGVPVGESLGTPPSLPGWRLDRALTAAAEAAGAQVVRGRVDAHDADARRVRAVRARNGGETPCAFEAAEYVLATGKFAGGGIAAAEEGFHEPAFGCPVWVEHLDDVFDSPVPLVLTRAEHPGPQPLLAAGVHTDDAARPVDREGRAVYENVRAAGSVRAGRETARLGLGGAANDGWNAGERAAEAA